MQRGTSHRKKDKSSRSTTPERPRNRTAASSKDTKKVRHSDNDPAPSLVSGTQIPRGNVSIGTSIRGTDPGRKKQLPSSDVADVLFRIKMCITQWKLMNKKIEIALQKRKKKAVTDIRCATLALVQKQGVITELQSRVDKAKFRERTAHVHEQLDQLIFAFGDIQGELKENAQILKQAILSTMEQIPLVDGAVLGDAMCPDVTAFCNVLQETLAYLERCSRVLNRFIVPSNTSPMRRPVIRSPSPRRSPSPGPTPLQRLKIAVRAGQELDTVVQKEVKLMKEVASLLEMKHKKQLHLNSTRAYRMRVKSKH